MNDLTLNAETFTVEGLPRRALTAEEFSQIEAPPCPVCGAKVNIDRIDVTLNEEAFLREGRRYIAGMWECPHHCDPRTGQRRHFSQTIGNDPGGYFFECSCGISERDLTVTQLSALREQHPLS